MTTLRIATRRSALAMWQARHVRDLLVRRHPGLQVDLLPIVTRGDRILDRPLADIGGKGLFLKELEQALLDGRADLAVHSLKDVPAQMDSGLVLDVVLERANPCDALLSGARGTLASLPAGSRVGTSSLRRQCQLLAARPDLVVAPLRGNVDSRVRKLQAGEYDAIILAAAGLERLGLAAEITQVLDAPAWLPAPGQGIIGIQQRAGDARTARLLAPLADSRSAAQAKSERAVARLLEGSCQVPLAAYARVEAGRLDLQGLVGTPDGRRLLRAQVQGELADAAGLGESLARELADQGAMQLIAALENPDRAAT